jgi:hypothetical protein
VSKKLYDDLGRQIVEVMGHYAYAWEGDPPLKVGEAVVLPPNYVCPVPWTTEITGLGSTYPGVISRVLGRQDESPVCPRCSGPREPTRAAVGYNCLACSK